MGEEKRSWKALFEEATEALSQWREEHPRATFTEIETTVDEQMARVRARLLQDMALQSASKEWRGRESSDRPKCPVCGEAL